MSMTDDFLSDGFTVSRITEVRTILSITDGHMIARSWWDVRKLFAYLVGDEDGDLSDAGAVELHAQAAAALLAEFPKLADVVVPDGLDDDAKIEAWLDENGLDFAYAVPLGLLES